MLSCANLRGADLSGALLKDAYLGEAALRGADLSGAALRDASITQEQVHQARPGTSG